MLAEAITAGAWPEALAEALARWRETRDFRFARLVDRIAARCEPAPPPTDHAAWIAGATPYDPCRVTMLLDALPVRLLASDARWEDIPRRWPGTEAARLVAASARFDSSSNALERYAAIERWPDDPRVAPVLAGWVAGHARHVAPDLHAPFRAMLLSRLAQLRDARVLPRLTAHAETRPGDEALAQLVALLAWLPRPASDDALDALLARLEAPTELEALWVRAGTDREARAVLADALIARDDRRGTFISRQLAGQHADELVRAEWDRWLGPDLGAITVRDGTVFRDGMIETLRVGHHFTPRFAWTAVKRHRELGAVRTLRIAHPSDAIAAFALALPALEQVEHADAVTREAIRAARPDLRLA